MEQYIIDERTGWEYELKGEQYYPTGRVMRSSVLTPETIDDEPKEEISIGVWRQRHLRYIREHKKALYLDLFISGKLNAYLADVNTQADEMFPRLIKDLSKQEGVTEALKASDQIQWIQRMNNIRNRCAEIVNSEFIYH